MHGLIDKNYVKHRILRETKSNGTRSDKNWNSKNLVVMERTRNVLSCVNVRCHTLKSRKTFH